MSLPPCDYCGKQAHYMFSDGEVVCSSCNSRLPHSSREARLRIAELERENAELRKDAERYRFARSRAYVGVNPHEKTCLWVLRGVYEVSYDAAKLHGFDAAIDAALAKIKEAS